MKTNKKEFLNNLCLLFIIIPFFKPDIIVSYPALNFLFTIWQLVSFAYIFTIYFQKPKISKLIVIFIIYYGILLLSTLKNNGNILKWITNFTLNLGIIMIIEKYININKKKIFGILTIIFYVLTIGNTISFIVFPQGLAKTEYLNTAIYMLGIDNRFAFTYIPGLCIIGIYDLLKNGKITKITIIYFIITFGTLLYFWSAGALFAESLFIIYYIFIYKLNIKIKPKIYFYIAVISFVLLVFFRIQNVFAFLIVDILHKDLTLSDRTVIWDNAIEIIQQNKLLGIGIRESNDMTNKISAYHSHCDFLNILLQSGIIGLGVYWFLLYNSFARLNRFKNNKITQLISFSIGIMLIMLLVDTFDITANLFILICLAYNISYIIDERKEKNG